MMILLAVFVISLSSFDYYQEPLKGRADRTVNLTQNLIFAYQNYFAYNYEWPGSIIDGSGSDDRCKNSLDQLIDKYLGALPRSNTDNVYLNPFSKPITVNCESLDKDLDLEFIYIRQCVPENWVGYIVNALPNTHLAGENICSASDTSSKVITTKLPRPGWENNIEIEEVAVGEKLEIHDCPTGKDPDLILMSPRACMNSNFKRGRIPLIDPDEYDALRGFKFLKNDTEDDKFEIEIRADYVHIRGIFATFWSSKRIGSRDCSGQKNGKVIENKGKGKSEEGEDTEKVVWNDGLNRVFALKICKDN